MNNPRPLIRQFVSCGAAALSGLCTAIPAWAGGFDVPDQDAFVIGRGMAFVATADNPAAIYYNPAGITQLQGSNLRMGIYAIDLQVNYKSPSSGSFDNQGTLHAIPQFYYTYTPESFPLSFGLGVFAPFGLSQQWPQDTGFRTVSTEGSLKYYTANPVVALRLGPTLSIGAGLTANYAQLDLQQGVIWPTQPNDEFRFQGDGWAVGYNLGILWKPHEKVALGVAFRSATTFDLQGQTDLYNNVTYGPIPVIPQQSVAASTKDPIPLKVISGISFRPTPKWNFEFNADYTDWSCQDQLTIQQTGPSFLPLVPPTVNVPLQWESSWYYEFGATRYLGNGWLVSAGYIFNQNSVPSSHYSPLVADMDRHFFSLGTGYRGKRFDFDIAYQFGYGPTRTVSGSALSVPGGQTADGQYTFMSNAIAISVGVHF
jgi:long-chain fatty acid transport protein